MATRKTGGRRKYGAKAKNKAGGRSGKKVKSRKQAIAIGLSEARRSGGKVPRKSSSSRKRKGRSRKGN